MKNISTGEPSNLKTYLAIATVFSPKAKKFIQDKINESPNGENEEVIAPESQMLHILASLIEE